MAYMLISGWDVEASSDMTFSYYGEEMYQK